MAQRPAEPEDEPQAQVPVAFWWAFLGGSLLWALVNLQWGRGLAWDEVEFLKATDWIRRGAVPYRDFFEHHTPLSWYLMAPLEALDHRPGVGPILWLRWTQVPLWALAGMRVWRWMKEDGDPAWIRFAAMAALLGTPYFVFSALEYRVDTLGTVLVILGLDFLRREARAPLVAAGALFTLSVIANLRFAPFVTSMTIGVCFMDLEQGSWRFHPKKLLPIALGSVFALTPWLVYLFATHSAGDMWRWCVLENAAVTRTMPSARTMAECFLALFNQWDLAGLLLVFGSLGGAWFTLKRWKRPAFPHLLLLAQIVNLGFIAAMKIQYFYHFELTLCLMVPFLGVAFRVLGSHAPSLRKLQTTVICVLSLATALNVFNVVARNEHDALQFQDRTLKFAAAHLQPGGKVLDGCGWLPNAEPSYKYWFLPLLVRRRSLEGALESYTPSAFAGDPPALVMPSIRLCNWLVEWPPAYKIVVTHYLPTLPNVWLPGLSFPFNDERRAWTWIVPQTGEYRLLCKPSLMDHPWFNSPLLLAIDDSSSGFAIDPSTFKSEGEDDLEWILNGASVRPASGRLTLRRGDLLTARFKGKGGLGVMLVPKGDETLFQAPPTGVNFDNLHTGDYYRPL